MKTKKVIRNGKTAVLYSPGYGVGWSTLNVENSEILIFDEKLVNIVESGKKELITDKFMEDTYGIKMYCGGAMNLEIEWIEQGLDFEIDEYDGSESIYIIGQHNYSKA